MKLSKDNWLLTAYALGELGACEAAEVEKAVLADESLRAEVEAIRGLAGELEQELAAEPMPRLPALARAQLLQRAAELDRAAMGRAARFARGLRWAAVAAAAAVILAAGAVGIWVLLLPGGQGGTDIVKTNGTEPPPAPPQPAPGPIIVPTPSPYDPYPMGTPTHSPRHSGFLEPSRPSIGSAVLPARPPAPTTQAYPDGEHAEKPWTSASRRAGSTFGLKVDNASYRYVRQLILEEGRFPEPSYVRIEEMINHFRYDYARSGEGEGPLALRADLARCPWSAGHVLLRVAVQARGDAQAGENGKEVEVVARDARVRVDFAPGAVASWRLIGYDGDMHERIARQGERLAAGRQVTALYELVPAGVAGEGGAALAGACTVRLDYRLPGGGPVRQLAVRPTGPAGRFEDAPDDFRFAAAVAGFGLILRNSPYKGACTVEGMLKQARSAMGDDLLGLRFEFDEIIREAIGLPPAEQ